MGGVRKTEVVIEAIGVDDWIKWAVPWINQAMAVIFNAG